MCEVLTLPVPKALQEVFSEFRGDRFLGQPAEGSNGGFHLSKVGAAMPAHADVEVEAQALAEREAPLEVVCDQFRQFSARQHACSVFGKVSLERTPELRPGAVEQHSLIGLTDFKGVAGLLRAEPFDVSQRDDRALTRGQLGDGLLENGQHLAPQEQAFRRLLLPGTWRVGPHPVGRETGRVDRRFIPLRGIHE